MTDSRPPDDPSEADLDAQELALTEDEERELLLALAQAQAPANTGALAAHERAWLRALAEDADEPEATADELAAMAQEDGTFLDALRAAHAPTAPSAGAHERILRTALKPPVRRVRPIAWAASGLALAAAVLLGLRALPSGDVVHVATTDPSAELSRSTESLVVGAAAVSTSGRVDRIAQARTGDYRKNRFRSWGAR